MHGEWRLRDRAEFLRAANTVDALGGKSKTFSTLVTLRASVAERDGKEALEAGEMTSTRVAVLTVRKSSASEPITAGDRVTVRSGTWNIRSISQLDEQGRWLQMVIEGPI